jgi:hypothetical protein
MGEKEHKKINCNLITAHLGPLRLKLWHQSAVISYEDRAVLYHRCRHWPGFWSDDSVGRESAESVILLVVVKNAHSSEPNLKHQFINAIAQQ